MQSVIKYFYPKVLKQLKPAFLFILIVPGTSLMTGCKLGDKLQGEDVKSTQLQNHSDSENSTALADHLVNSDFEFGNFKRLSISLDLSAYSAQISGDYYVVKLFDADNTYYLGTLTDLTTIIIQLSLALDITKITLGLYSNTKTDNMLVEEILL